MWGEIRGFTRISPVTQQSACAFNISHWARWLFGFSIQQILSVANFIVTSIKVKYAILNALGQQNLRDILFCHLRPP